MVVVVAAAWATPSRRAKSSKPSPTSRIRSATSTTAPSSTTSLALRSTAIPIARAARTCTGVQGVMPGFGGQLSAYEIVEVICHERYTLGGADPTSEEYAAEYEAWCSGEAPVFEAVESGELDLLALRRSRRVRRQRRNRDRRSGRSGPRCRSTWHLWRVNPHASTACGLDKMRSSCVTMTFTSGQTVIDAPER